MLHKIKINVYNLKIENIKDLKYNNMVYRCNIGYINFFNHYQVIIRDFKTLKGLFNYIRKNLTKTKKYLDK
jgi:hypothetical protein